MTTTPATLDELGDAVRLAAWKPAAIRRAIDEYGPGLPEHVVAGMHAEAEAIDAAADEATLELAARMHPAHTPAA